MDVPLDNIFRYMDIYMDICKIFYSIFRHMDSSVDCIFYGGHKYIC